MANSKRISLMLVLCLLVFVSSMSATQAASKLMLKVNIDQPEVFWNYTFLTRDGEMGKPASIVVLWDTGEISKASQTAVIINSGKDTGKLDISTEKGALVNYRVSVRDAKDKEVGSISLQVKNTGQTEYVLISPPEFSEPNIVYGNEAAPATHEGAQGIGR